MCNVNFDFNYIAINEYKSHLIKRQSCISNYNLLYKILYGINEIPINEQTVTYAYEIYCWSLFSLNLEILR